MVVDITYNITIFVQLLNSHFSSCSHLCYRSQLWQQPTNIHEFSIISRASRDLLQPLVLHHWWLYCCRGIISCVQYLSVCEWIGFLLSLEYMECHRLLWHVPVILSIFIIKLFQRVLEEPELIKGRNMHFYLPPSFGETIYKKVRHIYFKTNLPCFRKILKCRHCKWTNWVISILVSRGIWYGPGTRLIGIQRVWYNGSYCSSPGWHDCDFCN